jgi:hypothetical protein
MGVLKCRHMYRIVQNEPEHIPPYLIGTFRLNRSLGWNRRCWSYFLQAGFGRASTTVPFALVRWPWPWKPTVVTSFAGPACSLITHWQTRVIQIPQMKHIINPVAKIEHNFTFVFSFENLYCFNLIWLYSSRSSLYDVTWFWILFDTFLHLQAFY